jgi:hypothetical protein
VSEANYRVGESFDVQFVWRIPSGDFLRALFEAEVTHIDEVSGKYVLYLREFMAARQEKADGTALDVEELDREYWALVAGLVGRRISLAFEADDARPLWLRLDTLTGEHDFFSRLDDFPARARGRRNSGPGA